MKKDNKVCDKNKIIYNDQIVAFIDILGFSEKIQSAQKENSKASDIILKISNAIEQAVESNINPKLLEDVKSQPQDPVFKVFSDCICISSDCIENLKDEDIDNFVFHFLLTLLYVQAELTLHGIFIRGGLTINKHYYNV